MDDGHRGKGELYVSGGLQVGGLCSGVLMVEVYFLKRVLPYPHSPWNPPLCCHSDFILCGRA